ncbi:MAG TPA: hypothetical protein VMJ10_15345 [Kofleriaceae bacterium]|nr:hypothetical protein [Kofleriaceae bacterium]
MRSCLSVSWVLAAVAGCHVAGIDYTGKSCPCPGGYTCDETTDTCTRAIDDAGPTDIAVDTTLDTPLDDGCYGTGLVRACPSPGWPDMVSLSGSIGTTTSPLCVPAQLPNACVIVANHIVIPAAVTLSGRGTRPLVLVGVQSIDVVGTIDVGSHHNLGSVGAGGNSASCEAAVPPAGIAGGAGGSFAGKGGTGGQGNGANGGIAPAGVALTELRGGCPGEDGGGTGAGTGGRGGGAVYLISPGSITIAGTIDASGEGGVGATVADVGGGGGGTGGLIGLDCPSLTIMNSAALFANGGGGSAGAGATPPANDGADALVVTTAAAGGVGDPTSNNRTGGAGSVNTTYDGAAGHASAGSGGGGGGGGAAGYVKLYPMQVVGGAISPPPS